MATRICEDPTREQMLAYLEGLVSPGMTEYDQCDETAFAVEEAIWWFACEWHGGQTSNLYAALSASPYRVGPIQRAVSEGYPRMLLDELEAKYVTTATPNASPQGWSEVET